MKEYRITLLHEELQTLNEGTGKYIDLFENDELKIKVRGQKVK